MFQEYPFMWIKKWLWATLLTQPRPWAAAPASLPLNSND